MRKFRRIPGSSAFYLLFRRKVGASRLLRIKQHSPEMGGGQSLLANKGMVLATFSKLSTAQLLMEQ